MRDIVIVGNGGFAREVRALLERCNEISAIWNIVGFVDNGKSGAEIVGDDIFLIDYKKPLDVVIAIGNGYIRKSIVERYKQNSKLSFPTVIDPSVLQLNKADIGEGNIICAGSILTVDIVIGNFNIINLDCTIGHDAVIGDYATINPGVHVSGNVHVGDSANIGTGTQIIQGVEIGHDTIVGAGAVVNKTLPSGCTAVGVPAKIIKYHEQKK